FSNGTELGDPDGDGTPSAGAQVTNPGSAASKPAAPELPTVSITSPANNATLSSTEVTITATAAVTGGTITMVEFFDGETFLDMAHGEPFSVVATLAGGAHVLTARATANSGEMANSAPVNITVQIGAGPITDPYPPMVKTDTTIE